MGVKLWNKCDSRKVLSVPAFHCSIASYIYILQFNHNMRGLLVHVLCLNWAIFGWAGQDDRDRRLLLSDPQMLQAQLEAMQRRIQALETQATVRETGSGE